MSLRLDPTDPADMAADQRLEEVASIFGRGILRLQGRVLSDAPDAENLADSSPTCLELTAPSRPDGVAG